MISFQDKIVQNINNEIERYINCISQKYKISKSELLSIWNDNEVKSPVKEVKSPVKEVKSPVEEVQNPVEEELICKKVEKETCPYLFKRGKNKGMSCGCKCAKNSKYCSKHKKYEKKEPKKVKNIVPVEIKKQTVIRMNKKINKFWHPETRMVFKSKEEKLVIGKCTNDNKIVPLTKDDINICKCRSFAYVEIVEEKIIKNKVNEAILDMNIQAKDIENILNELQINSDIDSDDELLEEED